MNNKLYAVATFFVLAAGIAACNAPQDQAQATTGDQEIAAGDYAFTTADGNTMPYTVAGAGDDTVVLVHCWMCDATFWSEQVPVLAEHYRVIAVDLPGHGEATAERANWSVSAYGADVAALIESLDLFDVVLVGHSMGGPVSLRAAALADERVSGIVAVDTLHDAEFEFSDEQMEEFVAAFESDFAATCRAFVDQMFTEDEPRTVLQRVRDTSCTEQRANVGIALMKDFGKIDMASWMADAGVPIRAINAAAPNPTRVETNRRYADFDVTLMEDVGHYLQMTRPGQFNTLLLEAVSELSGDAP